MKFLCDWKKRMLEQMIFQCGGFFEANEALVIREEAGMWELDHFLCLPEQPEREIIHRRAVWAEEQLQSWLLKLEAIDLGEWKEDYRTDSLDGVQWSLRYTVKGERERAISGSNAWPENWTEFKRLITELADKLPIVDESTNPACFGKERNK